MPRKPATTPTISPSDLINPPTRESLGGTAALSRDDLRRATKEGRFYVWPPNSDNTFLSVTNALNSLPKPAIPRWAAKVVAEAAVYDTGTWEAMAEQDPQGAIDWLKGRPWSTRDKSADIGTSVHDLAEMDAIGETAKAEAILASMGDDAREKAESVRDFFATVDIDVIYAEAVVYSETFGYAGTLDFIVEVHDERIISSWPNAEEIMDGAKSLRLLLDLKTGKGVYSEVCLQLAAYRYADNMVSLEDGGLVDMPTVHGAGVLHVPGNEWVVNPIDAGEESFQKFLRALALAKDLPLDRGMVGSPVLRRVKP